MATGPQVSSMEIINLLLAAGVSPNSELNARRPEAGSGGRFADPLLSSGTTPLLLALVGFNVGVELGQLAIVSGFLPLAYAFRRSWLYRGVALRLGSALIVMIAAVWMFERMFAVRLLRF